jgi:hypothetical protein
MYLVMYFNGHGQREKVFDSLESAQQFKETLSDAQARIWKLVE